MGLGKLLIIAATTFLPASALAASLSTEEASKHVGETVTVCGTVASANHAVRSRGEPTFLNLDKAYPNQVFTAVIWGNDRPRFGAPETLLGKHVCTTGQIKLFRGKPEMILSDPGQLTQQ